MLKRIFLIIVIIFITGCSLTKDKTKTKEIVQKPNNQDFADPYLTETNILK